MRVFRFLLLGIAAALAGCVGWLRPTPQPIATLPALPRAPTASTLVVFLPGRSDSMQDLERRGLMEELERAGVRADWIAVDAHLGYYFKRTIVDRLREDVFLPARQRGYERIVVVGISLGGLGALLGERGDAGQADALVLIAPYLGGDERLFAEITAAGGPTAWTKTRVPDGDDVAEQIWTFIGRRHTTLPPTWLVWGEEDRFSEGHRLLAPLLPPSRVRVIPGAHEWSTWQVLWRELCADSELFAAEKRLLARHP